MDPLNIIYGFYFSLHYFEKIVARHLKLIAIARASYPYTTACYPQRITLPGALRMAYFLNPDKSIILYNKLNV